VVVYILGNLCLEEGCLIFVNKNYNHLYVRVQLLLGFSPYFSLKYSEKTRDFCHKLKTNTHFFCLILVGCFESPTSKFVFFLIDFFNILLIFYIRLSNLTNTKKLLFVIRYALKEICHVK